MTITLSPPALALWIWGIVNVIAIFTPLLMWIGVHSSESDNPLIKWGGVLVLVTVFLPAMLLSGVIGFFRK